MHGRVFYILWETGGEVTEGTIWLLFISEGFFDADNIRNKNK